MRICCIAGGVGSARFLAGLVRVVDPASVTVVVNTGDDETIRGLLVCPDVDTVLYHLAGEADWERGWGLRDETFIADERYRALGGPQPWFSLGDRDLATHLFRAALLSGGATLSEVTAALASAMGLGCRVLPMSDDPAPTRLETAEGELLDFQDYFVRRRHSDTIVDVRCAGGTPAPGVLDAIASADIVVVPPSNPLISIGPVLEVAGVRQHVRSASGRRIGVSPIVGGRAVKGPADSLLASMGHEVSALGVARLYEGLLDEIAIDERDAALAPSIEALGMRVVVLDTIMRSGEDAARLAKEVVA